MSIITLDEVIEGMQPLNPIIKVGVTMEAIGLSNSHFYSAGSPGAAVAPSPGVNGAALTTYAGQIPFTNPVSGNSYLASVVIGASQACTILVCDRLWHNSGLSVTSTSSQGITSPTWPARDRDGTTNGAGLLCGIEWSAAGGSGVPVVTLGYTNQNGTSGRTATITAVTTPLVGTFERFGLQAGDTGIRSIQSYQANATRTSGTFHLVVYRVLAVITLPLANVAGVIDAITGGFPRLYDNTVPFLIQIPSATTATTISGALTVSQG